MSDRQAAAFAATRSSRIPGRRRLRGRRRGGDDARAAVGGACVAGAGVAGAHADAGRSVVERARGRCVRSLAAVCASHSIQCRAGAGESLTFSRRIVRSGRSLLVDGLNQTNTGEGDACDIALQELALAIAVAAFGVAPSAGYSADGAATDVQARLNRLEAEVTAAEDLSALKRLQRAYGYYLDKGMWEDLQAFFTDDAVANYPAGIYVGHESIQKHLFLNVGGRNGAIGLGNNRLVRPHAAAARRAPRPRRQDRQRPLARTRHVRQPRRWRHLGGRRVRTSVRQGQGRLEDQQARLLLRLRRAVRNGLGRRRPPPAAACDPAQPHRPHAPRASSPQSAASVRPRTKDGLRWFPGRVSHAISLREPGQHVVRRALCGTRALWSLPSKGAATPRSVLRISSTELSLLKAEQDVENLQRIYGYYIDRAMWDQAADLFAEDATFETGQQGVYVGKKRVREYLGTQGPQRPGRRLAQRPHPAAAARRRLSRRQHRARPQPRARHDRQDRRPGLLERRRLRKHLCARQRRVEDQVAPLLSHIHHGLRQGLGQGRATRSVREHAAAARSPADRNVRDLSEAARPAVPLSAIR